MGDRARGREKGQNSVGRSSICLKQCRFHVALFAPLLLSPPFVHSFVEVCARSASPTLFPMFGLPDGKDAVAAAAVEAKN